jgi:hypothetical protein
MPVFNRSAGADWRGKAGKESKEGEEFLKRLDPMAFGSASIFITQDFLFVSP